MKAEEKTGWGVTLPLQRHFLYLDGAVYLPICEEMRKRLDAF